MDIDKLITNIKSRLDYHQTKLALGDKWQPQLIFTQDNGTWCADRELISFLNTMIDKQQTIILLDYHSNPVKIDNIGKLLSSAVAVYNNVMSGWYQDYSMIGESNP